MQNPISDQGPSPSEDDELMPRMPPLEIIVRQDPAVSRNGDDSEDEYMEAIDDPSLLAIPDFPTMDHPGFPKLDDEIDVRFGLVEAEDGCQASSLTFRRHRRNRHRHRSKTDNLAEAKQEADAGSSSSLSDEDDDELTNLDVSMGEEFVCFPFDYAKEHAGQFVKKVWEASWKATHFYSLPEWLQDNDFLHHGHRPPLQSFSACFKSIFRIHTETGNIWSHMLGCVAFIGVAAWFLTRPQIEVQWQEKLVFSAFFMGAIACLGLSFAFHTVYCHSERVGKLFSKLDYVGISLLIIGSFVPWLFYGFYCRREPKIVYTVLILALGAVAIVVSLWDRFSTPTFRPLRAGLFIGLGLSGVVPCIHYLVTDGFYSAFYEAALGWLILMAALYIGGALLYAWRIPERFFPGKCDLWFQSHQIFHLFVVIAAFVHYHGITEMAVYRLQGSCEAKMNE